MFSDVPSLSGVRTIMARRLLVVCCCRAGRCAGRPTCFGSAHRRQFKGDRRRAAWCGAQACIGHARGLAVRAGELWHLVRQARHARPIILRPARAHAAVASPQASVSRLGENLIASPSRGTMHSRRRAVGRRRRSRRASASRRRRHSHSHSRGAHVLRRHIVGGSGKGARRARSCR